MPAIASLLLAGVLATNGASWTAKDVPQTPGDLYALSYKATPSGKGLLNGGPVAGRSTVFNMDFPVEAGKTNERSCVFVYPAFATNCPIRLGTYNMPGGASWRDITFRRVRAEYARLENGVELGAGEAVDGNVYRFMRRNIRLQGPHVRPFLKRTRATFNTTIWRHSPGAGCEYVFNVAGRRFTNFEMSFQVSSYSTGTVYVAVSTNGGDWRDVAVCDMKGSVACRIPDDILPASHVFVRTLGESVCSMALGFPSVKATIDGEPFRAAGSTHYVDAETGETVGEIPAPDYYAEDWGEALDVPAPGFTLWRADEEMRVAPWRRAPTAKAAALAIAAAANEAESVQLVVKAGESDLGGLRVSVAGDLKAKDGAGRIPADAIDVRRVTYLDIESPTDESSAPGLWPEVLETIPVEGATVPAGQNRPFWVRVKVPKGTPAGLYKGALSVTVSAPDAAVTAGGPPQSATGGPGAVPAAEGTVTVSVPLEVEVFGFELPDTMTLKTSFGCADAKIFPYHRITDARNGDTVRDLYYRTLSAAHLTPYHPAGHDGHEPHWSYTLSAEEGKEDEAVFTFAWDAWDAAISNALARYHFNSFVFSIPGFTKADFRANNPHDFHGRKDGTPEYEALVSKYFGAIEAHLRERGWLDMAGIYWFDEPTEKDYPFIRRGLRAIRKYAPALRCRITEEPQEGLMDVVNLWCPTSMNLHSPAEAACRARGDEFWWYICMYPKAPYATEFIDHPGTDLRVWLWQTWQERIRGILVWETVYWTSRAVYPLSRQNPYEDAASWADSMRYNWGNGDGRFLYPPRACFDKGDGPILEPPNGSMRLEILRDGIEDYEYFAILSRLDPGNALLEVPSDISKSQTDFTRRPAPIKAHRLKLAREIERLSGGG